MTWAACFKEGLAAVEQGRTNLAPGPPNGMGPGGCLKGKPKAPRIEAGGLMGPWGLGGPSPLLATLPQFPRWHQRTMRVIYLVW